MLLHLTQLRKKQEHGYTLIEMAIVIIISVIFFGSSIMFFGSQLEISGYSASQSKLALVQQALNNYMTKFSALPCPSDPTAVSGGTAFNTPATSCYSNTTCSNNLSCNTAVAIGAVPTATLGLGEEAAVDYWQNKIIYAVDRRFTQTYSGRCQVHGNLNIVDNNGNLLSANGSSTFVLISTGKDRSGSYSLSGTIPVACLTTAKEGENCNNDATFRDGLYNDNTGSALYYDDIIAWNTNANVATCPAGVPGCYIWLDGGDPCSVTYTTGNIISAWQDKSTNNFSASAIATGPTFITTPTGLANSYQYLQFAITPTLLSVPVTGFPLANFTIIMVFMPPSTLAAAIMNTASSASYAPATVGSIFGTNSTGQTAFKLTANTSNDAAAASLTVPTIATFLYNSTGTQGTLFINGNVVDSDATDTNAFAASNFIIGGYNNVTWGAYNGKLMEVIIYNSTLTIVQQRQIETYLSNKWGVPY